MLKFLLSSGGLLAVFMGYQYYAVQQQPPSATGLQAPTPATESVTPAATPTPTPDVEQATQEPGAEAPPTATPEELTVELPRKTVHFSQEGGCVHEAFLSDFRESKAEATSARVFGSYENCKAFGFRINDEDLRGVPARVERIDANNIRLVQQTENFELSRVFTFSNEGFQALLSTTLRNTSNQSRQVELGMEIGGISDHVDSGGWFSGGQFDFRQVIYRVDGSVKRQSLPFEQSPQQKNLLSVMNTHIDWVGSGSHYFVSAVLPRTIEPSTLTVSSTGFNLQKDRQTPPEYTIYDAWFSRSFNLGAGESRTYEYDLFIGPKSKQQLDAFQNRGLDEVIDYGFFSVISWPLFHVLRFFYQLTSNWGVAIILLTICIKMILYPLTLKSYLASKKMQKMAPKMNEIKELYKDDKQRQQQEVMKLMTSEGGNPLAGCLPMLAQMPVFFALWSTLQNTFELRHASFVFWLQDLSTPDPYFISPVIMGALQFLQTKLTPLPPTADQMQVRLMQFMPILFALFMLSTPSGLVLYIITNTTVHIFQQMYMMRKYKEV